MECWNEVRPLRDVHLIVKAKAGLDLTDVEGPVTRIRLAVARSGRWIVIPSLNAASLAPADTRLFVVYSGN